MDLSMGNTGITPSSKPSKEVLCAPNRLNSTQSRGFGAKDVDVIHGENFGYCMQSGTFTSNVRLKGQVLLFGSIITPVAIPRHPFTSPAELLIFAKIMQGIPGV